MGAYEYDFFFFFRPRLTVIRTRTFLFCSVLLYRTPVFQEGVASEEQAAPRPGEEDGITAATEATPRARRARRATLVAASPVAAPVETRSKTRRASMSSASAKAVSMESVSGGGDGGILKGVAVASHGGSGKVAVGGGESYLCFF